MSKGQGTAFMDLLLLVGDQEVLVVESKVHAGYRMRIPDEELAEAEPSVGEVNRMVTYGRWLGGRCRARTPVEGRTWPGALVLLTHRTDPPAGFEAGRYGVGHLGVCRWRQVQGWAETCHRRQATWPGRTARFPRLATEFAGFLKEQGMGADLMTADGLSGAAVHFVAAEKARRSVEVMHQRLRDPLSQVRGGKVSSVTLAEIRHRLGVVPPPRASGSEVVLGCGASAYPELAPERSRHHPPLPSVPHVFVMLDSDGDGLPRAALASVTLPDGSGCGRPQPAHGRCAAQ